MYGISKSVPLLNDDAFKPLEIIRNKIKKETANFLNINLFNNYIYYITNIIIQKH